MLLRSVLKFDESKIRREPAGSDKGGQFAKMLRSPRGTIAEGLQDVQAEQAKAVAVLRGGWGKLTPDSIAPGMERMSGNASLAAIMNAPLGTGFENTPRAANFTVQEHPYESKASALLTGTIQNTDPLGGGVNSSFLVTLEDGTQAVYKPEAGELWARSGFTNSDISDYITNKDFSLAARETFAHEAGNALFGGPEHNPVPETVLREQVGNFGLDLSSEENEDPDSYDQRQMYEEYKQEQLDGSAMDRVGQAMEERYSDAQEEHAKDIQNRADEMADIWNEAIKDFPDETPYGTPEGLVDHPVFPMGSKAPFRRGPIQAEQLDPLAVLKEADVDVSAPMNREERANVEAVLRKRLEEGYQELGDVDQEEARNDLDRDRWIEDHADTEGRLMDEEIQTFRAWQEAQGYGQGGERSDGPKNPDAPHPNGGSLQKYVELNTYGALNAEQGAKMAVLDYVIGTMDRHESNIGWHRSGGPGTSVQVIAIDNGYSMPGGMPGPDKFTFRSKAVNQWQKRHDSGEVPEAIRGPILARLKATEWQSLLARHPGMSQDEREAFLGRIENMKEALSYSEGLSELWNDLNLMH